MDQSIIDDRLEFLLQEAEHTAKVCFRDVAADAAGRGALQSSGMLLQKIACLGDAIDALVTSGLADVNAIEAKGSDPTLLYETLTTKVVQLKLRGMELIFSKADWAGASAKAGMTSEIERRLMVARNRIRHHQLGFDRPVTTSSGVSVTGSQNVIVQSHSPNSSASMSLNVEMVGKAISDLDDAVPWPDLPPDAAADIRAEIDTIRAQLRKSSPSGFIVRESGRTLRSLVENVAASVATPHLVAAAVNLWAAVGLA